MKAFFRGRDKPPFPYGLCKSERWFFPSPMTPTLFLALLGESPRRYAGSPSRPPNCFASFKVAYIVRWL